MVGTAFLFLFQELLGGWCELSRSRSPFPPANSIAAFSFGERGAKEKAKQKEKRRWGNVPLFEKSGAKTFETKVVSP